MGPLLGERDSEHKRRTAHADLKCTTIVRAIVLFDVSVTGGGGGLPVPTPMTHVFISPDNFCLSNRYIFSV